jgi:regulator of protease activity HflC (stomatin/prohibitin superfamily)
MDEFPIFIFYCAAASILFIIFLVIASSLKIVQQNRVKIVERLGKFHGILDSGLNLIMPFIDRAVVDISLAYQNQVFSIDTVTKDKVVVKLKANLIYGIRREKVSEYYYELANAVDTLSSYVENYVRSYVSSQTHEELLERREELSEYLIKHLDEKMSTWGIEINSIQVMDIIFPSTITDAMSKVVASQRLREAALNEAEASKIRVVKQAEAEKESRILLGEGVAGERRAIIDGLKNSIDDMKSIPELKTDEVMNLVVVSQYFDTIRAVGESENTKVMFLNPAPNGANDLIQNLSTALESAKEEAKKQIK